MLSVSRIIRNECKFSFKILVVLFCFAKIEPTKVNPKSIYDPFFGSFDLALHWSGEQRRFPDSFLKGNKLFF